MSVAAAANYPQYADTDIRYIPEVYAADTIVKYYAKSVLSQITNTKYEGLIANQGDVVWIRTRPDITIRDYRKGMEVEIETPESAPIQFPIDQGKYWAFTIDNVDSKQADIVLSDEFTTDASEQLRTAIDTDVLGTVYADAAATHQGATAGPDADMNLGASGAPLAITPDNVLDVLALIEELLADYNVPEDGHFGVVAPWFRRMIKRSDLANASFAGTDASLLRGNGQFGNLCGFDLFVSNLLSKVTDSSGVKAYHMIFEHKDAISYAVQLVKNEPPMRREKTFGVLYKGLTVYGRKVVKDTALVHLYAYKG